MNRVIDIAIGMSDGLIVPLALSAGMYAAGMSEDAIFEHGMYLLAAGTVIMTAGGYLAGRSGLEKPVVVESNNIPLYDPVQAEEEATRRFLSRLDLDTEIQDKAVAEWQHQSEEWAGLMDEEWQLAKQQRKRKKPLQYAVNIGGSYLLGGLVPLLPYLFFERPLVFPLSAAITILLVFMLGVRKSISLELAWWKESTRLATLSVLAAGGAFAVGHFFF